MSFDLNEDGIVLAICHDHLQMARPVPVFSLWTRCSGPGISEKMMEIIVVLYFTNPSGNVIAIEEPGSNVESTNDDPNWNDLVRHGYLD